LAVYGRIGQQLMQALQLLTREQEENKRLRELCEKNKVDYKPKPTTPPTPKPSTPPTLPETKK